jgi:hypothetical protein
VRALTDRYRIDGPTGRVDWTGPRVSGYPTLESRQRFLKSALRIVAQGGELEPLEVSTKVESGRTRIHWDRAPDIWIRCTVVGPELVVTTQPAIIPTLDAWVYYAAVLASSIRWRTRHGQPFVRLCAVCKKLFVIGIGSGRPAVTCDRDECTLKNNQKVARDRQARRREGLKRGTA